MTVANPVLGPAMARVSGMTAAGAAAAGAARRAVPSVAPLLPPGPLRTTAQAVGNPVGTAVGAALDAGHKVAGTASDAGREGRRLLGPAGLPSPGGLLASRVIVALAAGLVTLEVVAQVSGRYFTWSTDAAAARAKAAAQTLGAIPGAAPHYLPLYQGQDAALAALAAPAPAPAAAPTLYGASPPVLGALTASGHV